MKLREQLENELFDKIHSNCGVVNTINNTEKIAKNYANNQIEKICDSANLDKIIHSKSYAEARRIIRTLIQPE